MSITNNNSPSVAVSTIQELHDTRVELLAQGQQNNTLAPEQVASMKLIIDGFSEVIEHSTEFVGKGMVTPLDVIKDARAFILRRKMSLRGRNANALNNETRQQLDAWDVVQRRVDHLQFLF